MTEKLDVYDSSGARAGEAIENGRDGFAGGTKYRVNDNYGREVGTAVEKPDGWGGTNVDLYDKHGRKVGEAAKQTRSSSTSGDVSDWLGIVGLLIGLWILSVKYSFWSIRWLWRHPKLAALIFAAFLLVALINGISR